MSMKHTYSVLGADGVLYRVYEGETFDDVAEFFETYVLGTGKRSKVIGKKIYVPAPSEGEY